MTVIDTRTRTRSAFRPWERAVLLAGAVLVVWGVVASAQYLAGSGSVRDYVGDWLTIANIVMLWRFRNRVRRGL